MRIAVLTSGGVAPGMNAAVRAVAQAAFSRGWEAVEVESGYAGLLEGDLRAVEGPTGNLMQRGGSVLGTQRSEEFDTDEGKRRAIRQLEEAGVDGLVVIGGGGTLAGGLALCELGMPVAGVPATIDNDVAGTDVAIGVDTALNTAVVIIDRIKDTAGAHRRAHVVEVMGRDCGYLAVMSAIGGGAEAVLVPEFDPQPESLLRSLNESHEQGKPHFIVVASEGASPNAEEFCEYLRDEGGHEADLTSVDHIQSGGSPTALDRIIAGRLGAAAVDALADRDEGIMTAIRGEQVERVPLGEVVGKQKPLDRALYELAGVLSEMPG